MPRATLGLAALLGIVAIALLVHVFTDGDDTAPSRGAQAPAPAAAPQEPAVPTAAPGAAVVRRASGYALRPPRGWLVRSRDGALLLASRDRTLSMAIAASSGAGAVAQEAEAAVRARFDAHVVDRVPARLGDLRGTSTELVGRRAGTPLRVLSTVASSRWRTYVVQVFAPLHPSAARMREAQRTLATFRAFRPAGG